MKRQATPIQPLTTLFSVFCLVVALTLAGCNADTLSGPDLDRTDAISLQAPAQAASGQHEGHNEGTGGNKSIGGQQEGYGIGGDNALTSGRHEGHNECEGGC